MKGGQKLENTRAGVFMNSGNGYQSFKPKKLPPDPPIQWDDELQYLLSQADRKLGRLDGITQILPNPELFVAMYVQKEALLSSQIEGTQASFVDVLNTEESEPNDVREVVNYVNAMYSGLEKLNDFPLSLRLIRDIHAVLLEDGRGSRRNPGEFRTSQNWIGPAGCTLSSATFVPPSIPDMNDALNELELFFYDESYIPPLIKIALIHAQFETIHPFLDGNGRMGRLLITFWLCQQQILSQPLLYLSYFFKLNRQEYYDRLMDVRKKGDWENWVKFFLRGVSETSDEAISSAKMIIDLKEDCSAKLYRRNSANSNYQRLLDRLFTHPFITKTLTSQMLGISYPTASTIINDFCEEGILHDHTPQRGRNKKYAFYRYISILERGTK